VEESGFWPVSDGPVPSVDMTDLKSAWDICREKWRQARGTVAVGTSLIELACSPGADIRAVTYRCAMLQMLENVRGDLLAPWKQSGQFQEAVFGVAAKIPMNWIGEGLSQLPFDVDAFLEEVRKQSP